MIIWFNTIPLDSFYQPQNPLIALQWFSKINYYEIWTKDEYTIIKKTIKTYLKTILYPVTFSSKLNFYIQAFYILRNEFKINIQERLITLQYIHITERKMFFFFMLFQLLWPLLRLILTSAATQCLELTSAAHKSMALKKYSERRATIKRNKTCLSMEKDLLHFCFWIFWRALLEGTKGPRLGNQPPTLC